jgi:hypothetical protein
MCFIGDDFHRYSKLLKESYGAQVIENVDMPIIL